jgi:hypothetical protein
MDLLENFLKYHLPGAQKSKVFSKLIITYFGNDKIFVIGLGESDGIITEQVRQNLIKRLEKAAKKIYFFSLFKNNEMFQLFSDSIAWCSYVWRLLTSATIHYQQRF